MKQVLQAYVFISLVMIASLSVLSYGYGIGYVYIYWREWQIQTSIWVLLFGLAGLSLVLHVVWWLIQHYLSRAKRQREMVFSFNKLHPYEQLAVIWLLEAGQEQATFIRQIFDNSGILKGVIQAKLLFMQGQSQTALDYLDHTHSMAFELAELQRIEIFLQDNNAEKVLTHLEFLQQHELSPWLVAVQSAYQQHLNHLWGVFALKFPWHYIHATRHHKFNDEITEKWLEHLIQYYDKATEEQKTILIARYMDHQDEIKQLSYYAQSLWLKLLAILPNTAQFQQDLAEYLLENQFNQDVFYLWFQQQILQEHVDYFKLEKTIQHLENKYPPMPIFTFSRWHIYQLTHRESEATKLLNLYPDHILMNYLRLKDYVKDREDLTQQLNMVFKHYNPLIEIKI